MILQIQHETHLDYAGPVSEWLAEVRMEPASDDTQRCHSFFLGVSQPAALFHYRDGFGNRVHHFNLLAPQSELRILAASIVETDPPRPESIQSRAVYPLSLTETPPELFSFLNLRGPVRHSAHLQPLLDELTPETGTRLINWVLGVSRFIQTRFEYAPSVTNVSSPVDDLLVHGKGVCQDFAHLMIAILRSFGVPARYVSGYIHRPNKESQSHAWCEAWIPDFGWLGVDPTNNLLVDDHFVRVAVGRDFTDVTPNKGIFRGQGKETMRARVETRELKRVPPNSWQENLPPLDVPLTVIPQREAYWGGTEEQQQQQQQQ